MRRFLTRQNWPAWVSALSSTTAIGAGAVWLEPSLAGAGMFALGYTAARWPGTQWPTTLLRKLRRRNAQDAGRVAQLQASIQDATGPLDTVQLVRQMFAQERYALLLRAQIIANLSAKQRDQAHALLMEKMSLVPVGEVVVGQIDEFLDRGRLENDDLLALAANVYHVEPYFLDRHAVTNREYSAFVQAGGYAEMAIWDREVWPAMIDFVDLGGQPGPRFWKNGRYPAGHDHHPVVGVCWYEAAAYARWVGKRLPTDAEWVKASSWPVQISPTARVQRRFPWGSTFMANRANLWSAAMNGPVPVDQFADGDTVGGVRQMIGNVWEWTDGWYGDGLCVEHRLAMPLPMRSLRGGAYDTYFESQATCHFQSGDSPVARKHNLGFRCAVSLCDVASLGANLDGPAPVELAAPIVVEEEPAARPLEERPSSRGRRPVREAAPSLTDLLPPTGEIPWAGGIPDPQLHEVVS